AAVLANAFPNNVPNGMKPLIYDSSSRDSVSVYLAPDFLVNYGFKAVNSWGSQGENTIKNEEKPSSSYTAGASANYVISPRFSVSVGLAYQSFSYNIEPNTIYNQKQSDGEVGYYLTTSSGIVSCPYSGSSKIGDSLSINAT